MDLPDDILIRVFNYLDVPNRSKLRLNKRLDRLQSSVKNELEEIKLEVGLKILIIHNWKKLVLIEIKFIAYKYVITR